MIWHRRSQKRFTDKIRIVLLPTRHQNSCMRASIRERIESLDWEEIGKSLDENGYALTPPLLTGAECEELVGMYPEEKRFRSRIVMARYRFGSGEYKYFAYPLAKIVADLRTGFYSRLAEIANEWNGKLGATETFPLLHEEFVKQCHKAGQKRPTPLLLRYEAGDYNCLHQDLYGQIAFPLQLTCFLSKKTEYAGGEFVLLEQQPRAQSKVQVLAPEQGQAVMFTTRYRPKMGTRGYYRVNVRHGVSRLHSGVRYTLGVPFHDAE